MGYLDLPDPVRDEDLSFEPVRDQAAYASGLTERERQVLQLAAYGKTNEEIGRLLSISFETVKVHLKKALWQLNAANRTEAVAIALRRGAIA